MKIIALFLLIASLAFAFEINHNADKTTVKATGPTGPVSGTPATPVTKILAEDGLKWSCQSCAASCAYTGFPGYCADTYYCVCTYMSYCPSCIGNIC